MMPTKDKIIWDNVESILKEDVREDLAIKIKTMFENNAIRGVVMLRLQKKKIKKSS